MGYDKQPCFKSTALQPLHIILAKYYCTVFYIMHVLAEPAVKNIPEEIYRGMGRHNPCVTARHTYSKEVVIA